MGLDKVRIVCRDINIGSNKTILANSGVYVDMIHGEVSGMNINRYDIPLSWFWVTGRGTYFIDFILLNLKRKWQCIYISTEKKIPVNQLMNLMKQTYWAPERSEEDVLTAMKNSDSFGAFDEEDNLVGFAIVVTDFVSIWYLCDVWSAILKL